MLLLVNLQSQHRHIKIGTVPTPRKQPWHQTERQLARPTTHCVCSGAAFSGPHDSEQTKLSLSLAVRHYAFHKPRVRNLTSFSLCSHHFGSPISQVLCQSKTLCTCVPAATDTVSFVHTPCHTENKSQANKTVNRSAHSRFLTNQCPSFAPGYLYRYPSNTARLIACPIHSATWGTTAFPRHPFLSLSIREGTPSTTLRILGSAAH